jgi:maltose alpha-D-glucosyltransferase/alpha-amylase
VHPDSADRRFVFSWLEDLRERVAWRRGDAIVLAEANVQRELIDEFYGPRGSRLQMLFNFFINPRTFLSLARSSAVPLATAIQASPAIPANCAWATFLRNHDEVDLSQLQESERADVFAAFGPKENMQLYGRGIRRRLAPMLGNDRRRLELAYLLQFSLPGTPVLRYGEELGMGDDLSLPERNSIRTPMQWSAAPQAGFTGSDKPVRPVISKGEYGYRKVNVLDQEADPESLLSWFERMLRTLRECPEFGIGTATVLDPKSDAVLALRYDAPCGSILALINLADEPVTVDVGPPADGKPAPLDVFGNRAYGVPPPDLTGVELDGYGYRWIRLSRVLGRG